MIISIKHKNIICICYSGRSRSSRDVITPLPALGPGLHLHLLGAPHDNSTSYSELTEQSNKKKQSFLRLQDQVFNQLEKKSWRSF